MRTLSALFQALKTVYKGPQRIAVSSALSCHSAHANLSPSRQWVYVRHEELLDTTYLATHSLIALSLFCPVLVVVGVFKSLVSEDIVLTTCDLLLASFPPTSPTTATMKPLTLALTILPLVANAYKGDMTHYTPGLGSCGVYTDPSKHADIVALSREMMANGPNPNTNPKCGSKINIYNEHTKKTHSATIVDTCWACKKEDIDVNVELFNKVAPKGDGRVHGIAWGGSKVGGLRFSGQEMEMEEEEGLWVQGGENEVGRLEQQEQQYQQPEEVEVKMGRPLIMMGEMREMGETGCGGRWSRFLRNWNVWAARG
ncbi:MAG: hypothetical protein Q9220_001191 [cf. Caloplaca sp. 1 TL-2023]